VLLSGFGAVVGLLVGYKLTERLDYSGANSRGYSATREEAMTDFKTQWIEANV
jgi:hypothetical protein